MELWFTLSLLCALFYGLQSAYVKLVMDRVHFFLITWANVLFGLPILVAVLYVWGIPEIKDGFYLYFSVSLTINFFTWPLFVLAIRESDISLVIPLLSFTPMFILPVEYFLRGDVPGEQGLTGIVLIVIGAYVLNLGDVQKGVFAPIRKIFEDRGAVYMLMVAVLWSISATVDYFIIKRSSAIFYPVALNACLSILFIPLLYVFVKNPLSQVTSERRWLWLSGTGFLTALMLIFQLMAIDITKFVNYVISIKRVGMILSVLIGWLYFSEKGILFRSIGAILMLIGVFLIRRGMS